jgi:hypothetical protein
MNSLKNPGRWIVIILAAALACLGARVSASAQQVREINRRPFYVPHEVFVPDAGDGNVGRDSCFAVTPEDNICLYSNALNRLYLFDPLGVLIKKIDFRDYNYSGEPLAISDIAASPKGGFYLLESRRAKIISVSKDMKITDFRVESEVFAPGFLFMPAEARCDGNGNLIVYEAAAKTSRLFSAAGLSPAASFKTRVVPAGTSAAGFSYYGVTFEGSTLEITVNSTAGLKPFGTFGYDGYIDGIFMAETTPSGGVAAGVRTINNDRYEFHILELGEDAAVKSSAPVKLSGPAVGKAAVDSAGKILTLIAREGEPGRCVLAELRKKKPAED